MTDRVYDYQTERDWFVGKWGGANKIVTLGGSQDWLALSAQLAGLLPTKETANPRGFEVTVIKLNSLFHLVRFVVDMIKAETGRPLSVSQKAGALLVTEGEQLLLCYLPEGGVRTADFFGSADGFGDTLLIATRNDGKTAEFQRLFGQLGIAVENLNAYPDLPEIAETGTTFEENARLKAETIAKLTGKMVLADDSGLKVDVLGGLPGVWSARFSGPEATDASNRQKLLHELAVVFELEKRSAQFHCTLVVAAPGRESLVVAADWPGYIGFEEKGNHGFGYDAIFLVGETKQTAAELSPDDKNRLSHRGQAVAKLMEVFSEWLNTR